MAAVEHGNRQQVDEREIDGQQHHKVEGRRKPMLSNLSRHMGYARDTADFTGSTVAADNLGDNVEDCAG